MITRATPPVCPRGSARGRVSHDLESPPGVWEVGGGSEPEVWDGFLFTPSEAEKNGEALEKTVPAEKSRAS